MLQYYMILFTSYQNLFFPLSPFLHFVVIVFSTSEKSVSALVNPQLSNKNEAFVSLCQAPVNSTLLENYNKGVQMGCWGLVIYAMTAATCSGKHIFV